MAIRCKFRSSMNFDTVDIDGRPSISVRDLKSKIVHNKKLNICQDFDLVFSDALTGQEYNDENFQILSGSSVIIKRVPGGSVPLDMTCNGSFANSATKDSREIKTFHATIEEINFDDFGVDLCPVPEETLSRSDVDLDKKICIGSERANVDAARCSEPPQMGCQKLKASNFVEFIPRGPAHSGIEENSLGTKSKPDIQQCMELQKAINSSPPTMQNANFPSELKCSLCNTLFKDAVMIPCCQHSFCEKCIRLVLVEKARCPKCFSAKCRLEDLLPNVSLRQAIEHFLDSQILVSGTENAFLQYAPDGESGIQGKDVSCAMTNLQKEPKLPDSPTTTARGSNQLVAESAYVSPLKNNTSSHVNHVDVDISLKSCSLPHKMKEMDGQRHGSAHLVDFKNRLVDLDDFANCHGESQPVHGEVEVSNKKKRGLWVNTSGADWNFMESGKHKKADRTCYMCGSPDHLIRDCPATLSPFQPGNSVFPGAMSGYASHYWSGRPLLPVRPFVNMYGNPVMMPFNATVVPATPFAVPTHMPSMFGSLPAYGGYMRMGGPRTPVGVEPECIPRVLDHQEREKKRKISNMNMREESYDGEEESGHMNYPSDKAERLCDPKSHCSKERSGSYSEDSFTHRSHKRHRRERNLDDHKLLVDEKYEKKGKLYHRHERLSSEVEDMPCSSSCHGDERHKKCSRNSKKHHERKEQFHCDSSWNFHPSNKEKDVERKRLKSDVKRCNQKHDSLSDFGLEPSSSSDRKKKHQEKDLSHTSGYSKYNAKSMGDKLSHDRWLMVGSSNVDGGEDYHYNKQKRVY